MALPPPICSFLTKARRSPDGVGRGSAREIDLNLVADDSYLVGLEIARDGGAQTLPGLDFDTPGMERTLDPLAVEPAVGEHGEGVGANIVGGVDRAVEIVESDGLYFRFCAATLAPSHTHPR